MNELEIKAKLKEFLCSTLGIEANVLEYDTQLFGDSVIGLDSIDSLEIISFVDGEYGVQMSGVGKEHFFNIDSITKYIVEHKEG